MDIKIQGWICQATDITLRFPFPLSFNYFNESCTTAIVKKKLARQVFVSHLDATTWLVF